MPREKNAESNLRKPKKDSVRSFFPIFASGYGPTSPRPSLARSGTSTRAPQNSGSPARSRRRPSCSLRSLPRSSGGIARRGRAQQIRDGAHEIHEGPLPKGGEGMRVLGSARWCALTHKAAGLFGQREETPHQPPAPYSRGARKCAPHRFQSRGGRVSPDGEARRLQHRACDWRSVAASNSYARPSCRAVMAPAGTSGPRVSISAGRAMR